MNLTMERDTNLDCTCKLDDTFTSASSSSKEREKEIPLHLIWKTRLETARRLLANYAAFMTEETVCHELISNVSIPVACTFCNGAVAVLTCQCFEELVRHKNMVSAMLAPIIHTDTYNNEKPRASDGENSTIANPVKGAIFFMLQTLILEGVTPPSETHGLAQEDYVQIECDQVSVTAKACKTLACILEAGDKLGSARKGDNKTFLRVPDICRRLHSLLLPAPASDSFALHESALLLLELLATTPSTSKQIMTKK